MRDRTTEDREPMTAAQISSAKNLTTHVALVLDRSTSMSHLRAKVIQVADELVAHLAEQSKKMGQEWRISVYTFGNTVDCHIWDMDVLRLPSMKEYYKISGATALVDATLLALDDGDRITEHRGDHAFLVYVLTDGEENSSGGIDGRPGFGRVPRSILAGQMRSRIASLKDNRTVAVLAPDDAGVKGAQDLGFPNILLWDTSSEAGLEQASRAIKESSSTYMEARTQGVAGLRSMKKGGLFVGANLSAQTVKAANLKPLATGKRKIVRVTKTDDSFEKIVKPVTKSRLKPEMGSFVEIEKFVKRINSGVYPVGDAFYELVKTERVQGDKEIAVIENNTNKVFVGDGARQLLGLPDHVQSVKPDMNPEYTIFVQSNSLNRHLPHGSQVMVVKR